MAERRDEGSDARLRDARTGRERDRAGGNDSACSWPWPFRAPTPTSCDERGADERHTFTRDGHRDPRAPVRRLRPGGQRRSGRASRRHAADPRRRAGRVPRRRASDPRLRPPSVPEERRARVRLRLCRPGDQLDPGLRDRRGRGSREPGQPARHAVPQRGPGRPQLRHSRHDVRLRRVPNGPADPVPRSQRRLGGRPRRLGDGTRHRW